MTEIEATERKIKLKKQVILEIEREIEELEGRLHLHQMKRRLESLIQTRWTGA